ncbi:Casein kinase II regulatory subunit family protein [Trichomonas vaginalis G3]|uniref:Casein kinase II subunit beta n=1 Tax=Trichomonas vaginalis (strain ATCC PRA-98 / G3) TaxID=412133 RepID=A2F3W3_TRIV3|nr:protein kinase regulator protein [Trichomonas vaginalis G3]EAY00379.1 Casein kinase II regulatory subunit family protein [Trichomonas vaginalis G3]KAI5528348.1 protein kinase regulator protein [Trichomonas vaginalis G3]|eukprot:XP_001313308.1 Casein kinase II regulatory subunit family protein [Trichomonas vaginalis G3]
MAPSFAEWLITHPAYHFMIKISSEFLNDSFNFYGLKKDVENYQAALSIIKKTSFHEDVYNPVDIVSAIHLYGLAHQRFICTYEGCEKIVAKWRAKTYPMCPRYLCKGCICLPYGLSEIPNELHVKLFCPNCQDVYDVTNPAIANIDGAYFGPTYVHLLKQKFRTVTPRGLPVAFVPCVFGFKMDRKKDRKSKKNTKTSSDDQPLRV